MTVELTYNRMSKFYDLLFGHVLQNGRKKLANLISNEAGTKILEIGVGSGLMLPLYLNHFEITGIDVSEEMLKIAKKRIQKLHNKKIYLHHINGEKSNFSNAMFDQVVLPYVYSVTPDPDHLILESFRLCKPGGVIWILNHFSGDNYLWDFISNSVKSFSNGIGFRSDFAYEKYVTAKSWQIEDVQKVNVFGLSKIIKIRKPKI